MGEPVLSPAVTTSFATGVSVGACATGFEFSASGTISGWCSDAAGTGWTNTGHQFSFTVAGHVVIVTGEVVGTGYLQDLGPSPGCYTGEGYAFTPYWVVTLAHL